jgi:GTP-binding protein YchF
MRLGILGLSASGKTTIFNALTESSLPTGELLGSERVVVHTAAVDVPDARLEAVAGIFQPGRVTPAQVTYSDIGGLAIRGGAEGLPGVLVNQLEQMDGILLVLRAFEDPNVPHPAGEVSPVRDLELIQSEFLLHDMLAVDRRLEKLEEEQQKGARDRKEIEKDQVLFHRLRAELDSDRPLREADISRGERAILQGYGLLTLLPVLILLNTGEDQEPQELEGLRGEAVLTIQGKLEMEIAQLTGEDQSAFMQEFGISELGRGSVIRESYRLLDVISFFTGNEQEVRAWTLRNGGTCLEAADTIHSDMARGFIRAEVIQWNVLRDLGSLAKARSEGRLRLEGKDYVVQDGDVIYIRFNV